MRIVKAKDRLEAIEKAPRARVVRKKNDREYEVFDSRDDYYTYLQSLGKRVDKRWLANKGSLK
jgi:hypothetical protein